MEFAEPGDEIEVTCESTGDVFIETIVEVVKNYENSGEDRYKVKGDILTKHNRDQHGIGTDKTYLENVLDKSGLKIRLKKKPKSTFLSKPDWDSFYNEDFEV